MPGLDPRLDAVVARLLETDPEARYARASEVCQALEALVTSVSQPMLASGSALEAPRPVSAVRSGLKSGWRKVNLALTVVGALAVLSFGVRALVGGPVSIRWGDDNLVFGRLVRAVSSKKPWPANTDGDVLVSSGVTKQEGGRVRLAVDFEPGEEEFNAHAGTWSLGGGSSARCRGAMTRAAAPWCPARTSPTGPSRATTSRPRWA